MNYDPSIKSAGIIPISKRDGEWQVFLIQYRGYEKFWGCPKGHLNEGETHEQAACLELNEETNLTIKRFMQTEPLLEEFYWLHNTARKQKRILFFVAEVEGTIKLQNEETTAGQWFTFPEAIKKIIYPEGKELLRQAEEIILLHTDSNIEFI